MSPSDGSIVVQCRSGVRVLTLHGEHDISTEPRLSQELGRIAAAGGPAIVDLTDVAFMDSSILRTLVSAGRGDRSESVAVVAPAGREPLRLVQLTGLENVLRLYETCEAAISAIAAGSGQPGE